MDSKCVTSYAVQIDKLYSKTEINAKLKKIKVNELKEILSHLSIKQQDL